MINPISCNKNIEIAAYSLFDGAFDLVIILSLTCSIQFTRILYILPGTKYAIRKVYRNNWQLYHSNTKIFVIIKIILSFDMMSFEKAWNDTPILECGSSGWRERKSSEKMFAGGIESKYTLADWWLSKRPQPVFMWVEVPWLMRHISYFLGI